MSAEWPAELAPEMLFLSADGVSARRYEAMTAYAASLVGRHLADCAQPYSGQSPDRLRERIRAIDPCPERSTSLEQVLDEIAATIAVHCVVVSNPRCMAHLQCPPAIPALLADMVSGAANQSLDSWDQSPSGTLLEEHMLRWLAVLAGFDDSADGAFTSGGTEANLMGLLLARNMYARKNLEVDVHLDGLGSLDRDLAIVTSSGSHFSVSKAAAILGLGMRSVYAVNWDPRTGADIDAVREAVETLGKLGRAPFALVATAGTTDFGTIDRLDAFADIAQEHGLWLHVDAAYGGGLLLSEQQAPRLKGIERADSVAIDFHKLGFQPAPCGVFLARHRNAFESIRHYAEYLNPEAEEADGVPHRVSRSLRTTRPMDVLKLFVTTRHVGRRRLGELVDYILELAADVGRYIDETPGLELAAGPILSTVVFRYLPATFPGEDMTDHINRELREQLLSEGQAVIGRTEYAGRVYLKLTLLNPLATPADIEAVLEEIVRMGRKMEQESYREHTI